MQLAARKITTELINSGKTKARLPFFTAKCHWGHLHLITGQFCHVSTREQK